MPSDPGPNQSPPSNRPRRRPAPSMGGNWIWLLVAFVVAMLFVMPPLISQKEISYSDFVNLLTENHLKEVVQVGDRYEGEIKKGSMDKLSAELKEKISSSGKFKVERFQGNDAKFQELLLDRIKAKEVSVAAKPPFWSGLGSIILVLMPVLLLLTLVLIFLPRFRDPLGGGFLSNYIKSPAKRYERSKLRVTFDDVAGMQNAKGELQEVVEFLRSPEKFQRLGAVVPKGVLLVGPPGTGKTLLARAVAGEAGVPFFSISGSEFIQMFVGVGASRVRDMFKTAKENAPCLPGDTVVTLSGGRQVTIQEMFEKAMIGVSVPAMTDDFRMEDATVIGITRKPCPDLYQLTTAVGSIKATGNHLFPILREEGMEWVRADQLREGEYVAAPRHVIQPPQRHHSHRVVEVGRQTPGGFLSSLALEGDQGQLALLVAHDQIRDLGHADVLWSRIERIEELLPVEYVYDLCLDRHNCFVANNLVTHNCILFIDEIDAVGRMRGAGLGGGSDEREQTLNQILSEMDGFTPTETVIVMAATNRPDVLDSALLRPGRFDRHITIDRPTWQGRLQILKVHTRNKPLSDDVDLEQVARGMIGMTGADLRNLANEAALLATREGKNKIDRSDFERAADRVLIGAKREEVLSPDEKKRTAYHEAGHALAAWLTPHAEPLFKVTIVPRGRAAGVTRQQPDEDRVDYTQTKLRAQLIFMLGGRAADRLVFNELTSGASMDLKQATRVARMMVTQFGMSDRLGPVAYRVGEEHVFLGKEIQEPRDFGEGTANLIDEEVRRILREADEQALNLLKANRHLMDRLVEALVQKEELLRDEIDQILKSEPNNGISGGDVPVAEAVEAHNTGIRPA